MEYSLERKEGGFAVLSASYAEKEVLEFWKKAASRFTPTISMAGYRPGKAPLAVVEKQFGTRIADMATDMMVDSAVRKAFEAESAASSGAFDYSGGTAARGKAFAFRIEFALRAPVRAEGLETLSLPRETPQADPVQERMILQDMAARGVEPVRVTEGTPQDGDVVVAEVTGEVDGHVVAGMSTGTCRIRLAPHVDGEKAPDLDPVVRTLRLGETGHGTTICPDNYPDPSLRGREIDLKVTVKMIERRAVPPISDELARSLGYRGEAEMRAAAHGQALDMDTHYREIQARRRLLGMLEEWQGAEPSDAMAEECRRETMRQARRYLQTGYSSGEGLKEALASMKQEAADSARRRARGKAVLLAEADARGISVSESALDAVLAPRAARQGMSTADFRLSLARTGELHAMRAAMQTEKALEALLAEARKR